MLVRLKLREIWFQKVSVQTWLLATHTTTCTHTRRVCLEKLPTPAAGAYDALWLVETMVLLRSEPSHSERKGGVSVGNITTTSFAWDFYARPTFD